MASLHNRVLYIGMTSDLPKRAWEHKNKVVKGFTEQYNVDRLVYYEAFDNAEAAIKRERGMKEWKRSWKIELIEARNPEWQDLFAEVCA
jgi:putative endonuclease